MDNIPFGFSAPAAQTAAPTGTMASGPFGFDMSMFAGMTQEQIMAELMRQSALQPKTTARNPAAYDPSPVINPNVYRAGRQPGSIYQTGQQSGGGTGGGLGGGFYGGGYGGGGGGMPGGGVPGTGGGLPPVVPPPPGMGGGNVPGINGSTAYQDPTLMYAPPVGTGAQWRGTMKSGA